MALRSLIIVIDGVDEASGLEQLIEDFVLKALVPGGFRLVVTSRPTGIRRAKYEETFAIFDLKALSDAQMRQVIQVRGGASNPPWMPTDVAAFGRGGAQMQCQSRFFDHLLAFTQATHPHPLHPLR